MVELVLQTVDWVAIGFWILLVCIEFGIFLMFFQKYLKWKEKNKVQLAFCLVFLCLSLGRIFLIYFDYGLTDLNVANYILYQNWWKLAILFYILGIGFLFLTSEYRVFRGKDYFLFFIGFSIMVCFAFVVQDFFLSQDLLTYALFFAVFIPISYLYLAIKLPKLARKNVFLMLIGLILYLLFDLILSAGIAPILGIDIHYLYLISAICQSPSLLILAWGIKRLYFTETA